MEGARQTRGGWLEVRISSLLVVLVVIGLLVPAGPVAASPAAASITLVPGDEAVFVELINQHRVARGLSALRVDAELTAASREWSGVMATDGELRHAPDLSTGVSANWEVLGENVGVHVVPELNELFQAFVDSPSHHANLVDPRFDAVGVGVVHADGRIWTTHRFMAVRGEEGSSTSTSEVTPPTSAVPSSQPSSTGPPTTSPPTTVQPRATHPPPSQPVQPAPPATQPQRNQAPATQPPATQPQRSQPPATQPPATQPQRSQAADTEPLAPEPARSQPPATEPPVTPPGPPSAAPAPEQPDTQPPTPAQRRATAPEQPDTQPLATAPTAGTPGPELLDRALLRAVLIDLAQSGL